MEREKRKRHRVPRVKQRFTIQGLSAGDILLVVALAYSGYKLASLFTGNPLFLWGSAFLSYYLVFPRVRDLVSRYPGGYFSNYLKWLSSPDFYVPLPDDRVKPILAVPHNERDGREERNPDPSEREELLGTTGFRGERTEGATAP